MTAGGDLHVTLARKYPEATDHQLVFAVGVAVRGARVVGVDLDDPVVLVAAEARLRQELGLEEELPRLDPQPHPGRRKPPSTV